MVEFLNSALGSCSWSPFLEDLGFENKRVSSDIGDEGDEDDEDDEDDDEDDEDEVLLWFSIQTIVSAPTRRRVLK